MSPRTPSLTGRIAVGAVLVVTLIAVADRSWRLAVAALGLAEVGRAVREVAEEFDYSGSEVLDPSLYRTLVREERTPMERTVLIVVDDLESCPRVLGDWLKALTSSEESAVQLWVAAHRADVLQRSESLLRETGLSYRVLEITDLPGFVRRTGINLAPFAMTLRGSQNVTAIIAGLPDSSSPLIDALERLSTKVAGTRTAIHWFGGGRRLMNDTYDTEGLAPSEVSQ